MQLGKNQSKKIFSITKGNPLYITEILKRLKIEPNYNISELPENILNFFQKELHEKYKITSDDLLKKILSLLLVFEESPTLKHFYQILSDINPSEISDKLLLITPYLTCSQSGTYSFFHQSFVDSLRIDPLSIITDTDLIDAHKRIIAWLEPADKLSEGGLRFEYGMSDTANNLPHHYWKVGELEDDFSGFMNFFGRNNLDCEISCRLFLHKLVTKQREEDLLKNSILQNKLKYFFMHGNDSLRYALLRFFETDLSGYGYDRFKQQICTELIEFFEKGSSWYNEIFFSSGGVYEKRRLKIALDLLSDSDKITDKNQLRALHLIVGNRLCYLTSSHELYDPNKGIEHLELSKSIIKSMEPEDLYESSCRNDQYASHRLSLIRNNILNDVAIAFRRSGDIDSAIKYYENAIKYKEETFEKENKPFWKNRYKASLMLTKHNLSYILFLKGKYNEAIDFFCEILKYRAETHRNNSFLTTLLLLNDIFRDFHKFDFDNFIKYLFSKTYSSNTISGSIYRLRTNFQYCLNVLDINGAELLFDDIKKLREKEIESRINNFRNEKHLLFLRLARKDFEQLPLSIEKCLSIIKEQPEESKTILVADDEYYEFWEAIIHGLIMLERFDEVKQLFVKLDNWFKKYYFKRLSPRYLYLKSLFSERIGLSDEATAFKQQADEEIQKNCNSIAKKHLPKEAMEYIDELVQTANDDVLYKLYNKVKDRLANGFFLKG